MRRLWRGLCGVEAWLAGRTAPATAKAEREARSPPLSTGVMALDGMLGLGGLARSRMVEIFGGAATGKTALALRVVASAQRGGGGAAFLDTDHALDGRMLLKSGIDPEALWVSRPETGEEALEIAERLIESRALELVVIDTVAALAPAAEIDGSFGDLLADWRDEQAALLGRALPRLAERLRGTGCVLLLLNHEPSGEGAPGGGAVGRWAAQRLRLTSGVSDPHRKLVRVVKDSWSLTLSQIEVAL